MHFLQDWSKLLPCRSTQETLPLSLVFASTGVATASSGSVVAGPAVDRRDLQTHRPQIRRELASMVDQIKMKEPKNLAEGSLQKNLFARSPPFPFLFLISKPSVRKTLVDV